MPGGFPPGWPLISALLCCECFTHSLCSFVNYYFITQKIHIFAPPCNILYMFSCVICVQKNTLSLQQLERFSNFICGGLIISVLDPRVNGPGLELWLGTMCCILGQNTLYVLSHCLSPTRPWLFESWIIMLSTG